MDRRDFLKTAAAVPATAVTPQQQSPVPEASTISRPGSDFMVDILKSLDFEYAFSKPTGGNMPPYTSKVISDPDLIDINAYLRSIPPSPSAKTLPLLQQSVRLKPDTTGLTQLCVRDRTAISQDRPIRWRLDAQHATIRSCCLARTLTLCARWQP